jgi:hypothetical protein
MLRLYLFSLNIYGREKCLEQKVERKMENIFLSLMVFDITAKIAGKLQNCCTAPTSDLFNVIPGI